MDVKEYYDLNKDRLNTRLNIYHRQRTKVRNEIEKHMQQRDHSMERTWLETSELDAIEAGIADVRNQILENGWDVILTSREKRKLKFDQRLESLSSISFSIEKKGALSVGWHWMCDQELIFLRIYNPYPQDECPVWFELEDIHRSQLIQWLKDLDLDDWNERFARNQTVFPQNAQIVWHLHLRFTTGKRRNFEVIGYDAFPWNFTQFLKLPHMR